MRMRVPVRVPVNTSGFRVDTSIITSESGKPEFLKAKRKKKSEKPVLVTKPGDDAGAFARFDERRQGTRDNRWLVF